MLPAYGNTHNADIGLLGCNNPEDGGSMFLRNVGNLLQGHTTVLPVRPPLIKSSTRLLPKDMIFEAFTAMSVCSVVSGVVTLCSLFR
jgi:hypothetical protein